MFIQLVGTVAVNWKVVNNWDVTSECAIGFCMVLLDVNLFLEKFSMFGLRQSNSACALAFFLYLIYTSTCE